MAEMMNDDQLNSILGGNGGIDENMLGSDDPHDFASKAAAGADQVMDDFRKLPSLEEVMNLIESMKDLSDEDRQKLKLSLLEQQAEANEKLAEYASAQSMQGNVLTANDYVIFIAMIGLIITVFVLFGYKLYKSLMEKQRKREEKFKAKQSKKKK